MTDFIRKSIIIGCLWFILAGTVLGQDIPDTKVKYLSGNTVYLAGGKNIGLLTGDRLDIIRNGTVIAELEVTYIASASASCRIVDSKREIEIGDRVRFIERTAEVAIKDTAVAARTREIPVREEKTAKQAYRTYVSGGFSVQWYHRADESTAGLNFNQWNAKFTMRIRNLWTRDLNLDVNMRARFDRRVSALNTDVPEEEWRNRIYWISIGYGAQDAPVNFKAGRIASSKFSGMGYLDGLVLQHNISKAFQWGVFGGVQPDMRSVNLSTDLQKYGIYGSFESVSGSETNLKTTLALAGSYTSGEVNREYAYLEFRISNPSGWRINQSMEIDLNRSWRKSYSGSSVSLTSIYISGSYKFNKLISAGMGYDNRKNYVTYYYYSKPQQLFDEAERQSLRGDVWFKFPAGMNLSIRGGLREGANDAHMSYNYGMSFAKSDLLMKHLQANLSVSGFRSLYNRGFSPTASLRYQLGASSTAVAFGSYRYTLDRTSEQRVNQYLNVSISIPLISRMYFFGHYYYDWGDDMQGHRVLTEIGYRL